MLNGIHAQTPSIHLYYPSIYLSRRGGNIINTSRQSRAVVLEAAEADRGEYA